MSAEPLPASDWGSDRDPPLPPTKAGLPWWIALCLLPLVYVAWSFGWLGLPILVGTFACCWLGAQMADADVDGELPPSVIPFPRHRVRRS